ncbi:MAG: hypothetical protein GY859_19575 [Desulfobacterales bacterium]|nr:hypothetical protein [Desulfobacterales bacterium]
MIEKTRSGFFLYWKSSPWGPAIQRVFAGLFGTLLVVLFLTGFMPLAATIKWIPWIIGFNAAAAGYTLIHRARGRIRRKKTVGAGAGFLVAAAAGLALNSMSGHMTGVGLIYWTDLLFFSAIGALFGGLGAMLSVKYAAIEKSR